MEFFIGELLVLLSRSSADVVTEIINNVPAKSSHVDSTTTSIVKSCADLFAPLITCLAELSFNEDVSSACFQTAAVIPLLEKKWLDSGGYANFVHTMSKMIEK
jgi:hypothetical protein